jgi:hypothetical protein
MFKTQNMMGWQHSLGSLVPKMVLIVILCGLAGCQTASFSSLNPFSENSTPQPCPPVSLLANAVTITKFGRGESIAAENIIYSARLEDVVFECQVVGSEVRGRLSMAGMLDLGRKGTFGSVTLPVFIALVSEGSEVTSKRFDTIELDIPRGSNSARVEKTIPDYTFLFKDGENTLTYEILIGFNLTREQVFYNRNKPGA